MTRSAAVKAPCASSSKTYSAPSRTRTRLCAVTSRTHTTRRRSLTTRLSSCPEEAPKTGCDLTSTRGENQDVSLLAFSGCSAVVESSSDNSIASHLPFHRGCARRPVMPPGPPTSPVPSPPSPVAPIQPRPLTLDLLPDTVTSNASASTTFSTSQKSKIPYALRNCLRRRRNAICGNNPLGQGLKDFFASYVMSHLSESMSYSLNLNSIVAPLPPTQYVSQSASDPDDPTALLNDPETSME